MIKYSTFEDYIKSVNETGKIWITKIREIVRESLPDVYETMGYGVPAFGLVPNAKLKDKIMVACYKNHLGFYPHPDTIAVFKNQLKEYKTLEGTIQIKYNQELPIELIKEMLVYRYKVVRGML